MSALQELIDAPARQAGSLEHVGHRPWPVPTRPWRMARTSERLLFAHWRADLDAVRALVPEGLEVDVRDGSAWLGVTPFRVEALRLRGLPPLPVLSSFLELNVRTYVTAGGKPGIWFLGLDASGGLAVEGAKRLYHLPYRHARMSMEERDGWIAFDGTRIGDRERRLHARYRGEGRFFRSEPGSLEEFLVERYCLYAEDGGRLCRAEIHHEPWSLQTAEAELAELSVIPPELAVEGEPLLHLAARQDALVWPLERI